MTVHRLMTFNIRYATPDDEELAWSHRRARVRSMIRDFAPTVIGIQEARPNQFSDLRNWFARYNWLGTCRRGDGSGEHVVLGYEEQDCKHISDGGFWLSSTPGQPSVGWDGRCPRVATWARLAIAGQPIHIVVTHLDHVGEQARKNGALLLSQYLSAQSTPTILMGDLNSTPTDIAVEMLTGDTHEPARETANTVVGTPTTFHGFGAGPYERIDYILCSSDLNVIRAGASDIKPPFPSDHNPVFADICVSE